MTIRLNIHEAKTHLSKYLKDLSKGDIILLCNRNVPIAEIQPIINKKSMKRIIGLAKGKVTIAKGFFDPVPHSVEKLFY